MSQNEMILDFLEKYGSISQAESITYLGCYRLPARIGELKERGHRIVKTMETAQNRFGKKTRYARYRLAKQALQAEI